MPIALLLAAVAAQLAFDEPARLSDPLTGPSPSAVLAVGSPAPLVLLDPSASVTTVDLQPGNAGAWLDFEAGRLWRVALESPGAASLALVLEGFQVPVGAELHVVGRANSSGGYTWLANRPVEPLAIQPLRGERVTLEYWEPRGVEAAGEFTVALVLREEREGKSDSQDSRLKPSAKCQVDVACPEGDPWRAASGSIVRIIARNEKCTGVLINNTARDGTPYVLTAAHCGRLHNATFFFNWRREQCGEGEAFHEDDRVSGSRLVVSDDLLDFQLVRLNANPDEEFGAHFAGWDISGSEVKGVATLHHPQGDWMKVSVDEHKPRKESTFWKVKAWETGITERGSSGAPLFDSNLRVIGQLKGGPATCEKPYGDLFGRLEREWILLEPFLDPLGVGEETLASLDPSTADLSFRLTRVESDASGSTLAVIGMGFTPQATLLLDGQELERELVEFVTNSRLMVQLPGALSAGEHVLLVRDFETKSEQTVTFEIAGAQEEGQKLPRVLFFTHSAGFVHGVVKRPQPDTLSHAEERLVAAAEGRFEIDCTQDCEQINAANLAGYDAVVFYTTGELPIPGAGKAALIDWVHSGGAFIGVHSATDTLYEFEPYMQMIGGAFDGHPWHEEITMTVEDPLHPAVDHLNGAWTIEDEIYQFRGWRRYPLNVLLSMQHDSVAIDRGKRDDRDYANAWSKPWGRGRVFYTALGHRAEVWENPLFQEHLLDGIEWAITGPDLPSPAPAEAVVLFDGSDLSAWSHRGGAVEAAWRLRPDSSGGSMEVVPGTTDLVSRQEFSDALLHVEFLVPLMSAAEGQARGNSGVYVQGRYEVQVLDSFGLESELGDCGSIYGKHVVDLNACRKPERWQSFDIEFTAPRMNAAGAKATNARMTVWHNGRRIHTDVEVDGPTTAGMQGEPLLGPLLLQDHGNPVRYRNVWVLPR